MGQDDEKFKQYVSTQDEIEKDNEKTILYTFRVLNITGKISTIEWDHESMENEQDKDNYYIFIKAGSKLVK